MKFIITHLFMACLTVTRMVTTTVTITRTFITIRPNWPKEIHPII
jgi:hypothetical protein